MAEQVESNLGVERVCGAESCWTNHQQHTGDPLLLLLLLVLLKQLH